MINSWDSFLVKKLSDVAKYLLNIGPSFVGAKQ